ncbi:MAG: hypothetical protein JWQ07_4032 [Ramlibacter sp.]|nr:hypothetical protein [Ramlibacter sp.]
MRPFCTIPQDTGSMARRLAALALAAACVPGLAAGTRVESEFSLEHDGNPARAERGEGVPAEFIQAATLRVARSQRIDERSGWVLHGHASLRQHDLYHGLNELNLGGGATYRIQPEVGFTAPWYELGLAVERSARSNSAIRNLTRGVASVSTGANLTDRISASAGLRLTRAVADSGPVFDQLERALDLEGAYHLGRGGGYARWSLARGDQAFSSSVKEYGVTGIEAEAGDPAVGPDFYAYRARALTRVVEAGAFVSVAPRQGWALWVRAVHSATASGAAYSTRQLGISWRYLVE